MAPTSRCFFDDKHLPMPCRRAGGGGERCRTMLPQPDSRRGLDKTQKIPQLLRRRSLGVAGADLPQLGALLGRGAYGKVYKGDSPLSPPF